MVLVFMYSMSFFLFCTAYSVEPNGNSNLAKWKENGRKLSTQLYNTLLW